MFPWQSVQPEALAHPYFPLGAVISGYKPNQDDHSALLLYFFTCVAGFMTVTGVAVRARYPKLSAGDFVLALWFAFAGLMQLVMQGYAAYNHARIPGATDVLGQLWKEYAKADSRYVTQDAVPFSTDALAATILAPLCFYTTHLVASDAPARHPLALVVSACQIWAHALYLATAVFERRVHGRTLSRPEPEHYWGNFVGSNVIWIVVPLVCILHSSRAVASLVKRNKDAAGVAGEYLRSGRSK